MRLTVDGQGHDAPGRIRHLSCGLPPAMAVLPKTRTTAAAGNHSELMRIKR